MAVLSDTKFVSQYNSAFSEMSSAYQLTYAGRLTDILASNISKPSRLERSD
jgi:hypothetical protein